MLVAKTINMFPLFPEVPAYGRIHISIKFVQINLKLECNNDFREAYGRLRIRLKPSGPKPFLMKG